MGDPTCCQAIAAIVLSGAPSARRSGFTLLVGIAVLFLTLMSSVLSVFQISSGIKQSFTARLILTTLVVYGRLRGAASR